MLAGFSTVGRSTSRRPWLLMVTLTFGIVALVKPAPVRVWLERPAGFRVRRLPKPARVLGRRRQVQQAHTCFE